LDKPWLELDLGVRLEGIELHRYFQYSKRIVGIVSRNDHSNDRCNTSGTEIGVALAPKGLDLFQPFLRGFVTVERLLREVEKEGFFKPSPGAPRGRP
jgi:hypothetical protein